MGILKQGYKTMPNYQWDFPIGNFQDTNPARQSNIARKLEEERIKRDKLLSHKKLKEIELL